MMACVKNAEKIGFQRLSKLVAGHFLDSLSENPHPGIVDQNIDAAEYRNRGIKQMLHLNLVPHITNRARCFPDGRKPVDRGRNIVGIPATNEYANSRLCQTLGNGET